MLKRRNYPELITSPRPDTALVWLGVAAILIASFIAYLPAINGGFIWDDDQYVTGNALLHDLTGLRRIWIPRQTPQYYPVVFTTFWIEHQLWQLNPMGYHIVNVLLHALNALLVWRVIERLRLPIPAPGAWLIAAVFALHPVHVESVAWITERKNVLSGFFYLVAALAYLRFEDQRDASDTESSRWRWYAAAFGLFVLALLSKSVTCSLPAALILMMLYQRKRMTLARLAPLIPMFIVGLILAINTATLERDHVLAIGPDFAFSVADRLLIASKALLFYPLKLLWPHPLIFVYPRWAIDDGDLASYWSVAVVVIIAAAAIIAYRRGMCGPVLALAFFAGTIIPALGFVNIYPMIFSFVADHFQYLASLGIIVLVVGGVAYLLKDSFRIRALSLAMLPILAWLTWAQSHEYSNLETLWLRTLAKNDDAWMAHNNLVPILLARSQVAQAQGQSDIANALVIQAREHGEKAVRGKNNDCPSLSNLSQALTSEGRHEDALRTIERALDLAPKHADYHWQRGYLNEVLNRNLQAERAYRRALELDPDSILFNATLARWLVQNGDATGAVQHTNRSLELINTGSVAIGPNEFVVLDGLARASGKAGRFDDAVEVQEAALRVARLMGMNDQVSIAQRNLDAYRAGQKPAR